MAKSKKVSLFDQLTSGLADSIAHSKGELSLKTTQVPPPPPDTNAKEVRDLRQSLRMSQAVFAATLNVSKRTIQSWEQGVRHPSDAALRMIQVVQADPGIIYIFYPGARRKPDGKISGKRAS